MHRLSSLARAGAATLLLVPLATPAVVRAQVPAAAVERVRITPAVRTIAVGDSLQLVVQALDTRGNVVPGAIVRFNAQGGRFQGAVDSLGWVRAGSPGTVPVAVSALVPGGRPIVEKIEVHITPGPAARVVVTPAVSKMLVGQRLRLAATALSAAGDARDDAIVWTSANPSIARVTDGVVVAVGAGTTAISARAGTGSRATARYAAAANK